MHRRSTDDASLPSGPTRAAPAATSRPGRALCPVRGAARTGGALRKSQYIERTWNTSQNDITRPPRPCRSCRATPLSRTCFYGSSFTLTPHIGHKHASRVDSTLAAHAAASPCANNHASHNWSTPPERVCVYDPTAKCTEFAGGACRESHPRCMAAAPRRRASKEREKGGAEKHVHQRSTCTT